MRVRTVYFKVRYLAGPRSFWSALLGIEPAKDFPQWCEFRVGEVNLGLLPLGASSASEPAAIPVLEFPDDEVSERIARAKELGASVVLEGEDHPDHPNVAAVLIDPFGNEFEITSYHGRARARAVGVGSRSSSRTGGTHEMIRRRGSLEPIDFEGLQIFDYTGSEQRSSSLAVIEVPAGAAHAEAWSTRSDKYYLVTRGVISFVLEGESFQLAEGDFCLVEQGQRFRYCNDGPEPASLLLVHTPSFQLEAEVFA